MLLSVLRDTSMDIGEKLLYVLIIAFCTLLSLSVHELAHGLVAYRMGDKTAKYSGRLSINPMHHLDPLGAICLFFFGFGWAKPVPVNPWNFNNKKSGMVWTSLGGACLQLYTGLSGSVRRDPSWQNEFSLNGGSRLSDGVAWIYHLFVSGTTQSGSGNL